MKRAALYARVSTDKQREEATIESQVYELKKQIATAGNVLVKEYIEDGHTGTVLHRPALDELRREAKGDVFDVIYFHSADRIAREVAIQTIIVDELLKRGKQIVIGGKDYEENPENKLTLTMLGAFAEFERAKILERTMRGRMHRIRSGGIRAPGQSDVRVRLCAEEPDRACGDCHQRRRSQDRPLDIRAVRQWVRYPGHYAFA
jgi:site-specific DNA recombinase